MKIYFSKNTTAFYADSLKLEYDAAGTWPDDAVEMTNEEIAVYQGQSAPTGKVLGADKKGRPVWIDSPPLTKEQLIEQAEAQKQSLLAEANIAIAPLQDAVDLDMATDEEIAQLKAWKIYRVYLTRVDTSLAPDIDWPKKPS